MYVSMETLRRAVLLVDSLADLDDPAGFAGIVLPGLAALVICDVLSYIEIGPAPGQTRCADYPAGALDPGIYAGLFRAIPAEHQIAISLPCAGRQVTGIALSRARHDFSAEDRALLSVLRAPLAAALLRARGRHQAAQAMSCGGLADLTGREAEILRLVAMGRTNTAIAHALAVSPRTVAKHLEHIYRKLGVSSRAAAVSAESRQRLAGTRTMNGWPTAARGPA